MHLPKSSMNSSDVYARKNEFSPLFSRPSRALQDRSLEELEELRLRAPVTTVSRHGLETVCGASCEVGAQ